VLCELVEGLLCVCDFSLSPFLKHLFGAVEYLSLPACCQVMRMRIATTTKKRRFREGFFFAVSLAPFFLSFFLSFVFKRLR
jgi:hypothetical protein